jgi:branched-chain amino acid transport system substrate-binding protein
MLRRIACIALTLLAASAVLAACGDDDPETESLIVGDTLTVYSSLPLRGPYAEVSRDLVLAEKLALKEAGGRAGDYSVSYVSLDSADPETGRWTPGRVASNARKAVQDRQTIAYLGELETGASAISVPILNEGGILQLSPRDTFGGLTARGARGEPEKYYPSGMRTFGRLVPGDDEQARELVAAMRSDGVRRMMLADDRELAGTSLGDRLTRLARGAGIEIVDRERLDPDDDAEDGIEVPDGLGREVRRERADAFMYAGAYRPFAVEVLKAVHAENPRVGLYGADDLALAPELPEKAGAAGRQLLLTGVRAPRGSEASEFARRFEREFGREPHPQAVLGYQAMRIVLDAVSRSGPDAKSRRRVIREALQQAGSPRTRFGRFRVEGNRLIPIAPQM